MELLTIKDTARIYQEVAAFLSRHKDSVLGAHLFVVEGTLENPLVAIRYPGRKMIKRTYKTKSKPKNFIEWANLCDFEVVAFRNGVAQEKSDYTYKKFYEDFEQNKIQSAEFCKLLDEVYKHNTITGAIPSLPGIDSELFLRMLKWMWIQEDFNYKYSSDQVKSPIKYRLQTLKGSTTSNGAGRARFYASLFLLRSGEFDSKIIPKIITSR
ncbi:MAG: hypothetical protein AAB480_00445 [Patescibacteria group bacterium]